MDHADETRSERNARIMREKPARFDGEDEISLPLSRKRRVPVYGNSRAAAFDARAARAGNPHVFGEPVLTRRPFPTFNIGKTASARYGRQRVYAPRGRTASVPRRSGPSRRPKNSARSSPTSTRRRRATRPRRWPSSARRRRR